MARAPSANPSVDGIDATDPGMLDASVHRMTLTRIFKLVIPAGHYVEAAVALRVSKHLRERVAAAPVVVALWPTGSQEVVWGSDYLTRARTLGQEATQILLLRVADAEDSRYLNRMVLGLKGRPLPAQSGKGVSAAQGVGPDRSRQDPGWRLA